MLLPRKKERKEQKRKKEKKKKIERKIEISYTKHQKKKKKNFKTNGEHTAAQHLRSPPFFLPTSSTTTSPLPAFDLCQQ